MNPPLVLLEGVHIRAGAIPILIDVDLRLEPGEAVGVAGPNGAGKTTLLSVVSTLRAPDGGAGTVLGAALGTSAVREIRPSIGWSGHEPALVPELTLRENLRLVADIAGIDETAVDDALDRVGLAAAGGRRADRSSNGMRRRIDLARLLMTDPRLLLLDEAHAGLDQQADAIIDVLLTTVRSRGGSALLVSHDADRLRRDVDRVVSIDAGRLV